jgi:hypothetical protein
MLEEVSQTSSEGSSVFQAVFHSDPTLPDSPIRLPRSLLPAAEFVDQFLAVYTPSGDVGRVFERTNGDTATSSPLSSPPPLNRNIKHLFLLKVGNRKVIR